jgi:CHAD domain-containing protein
MADGKWIRGLHAATPLAEGARTVLAVRLGVVQDALPRAVHEADRDPEHVHQLRVATRRADAALRLFAACLPAKVYKKAKKRLRSIRRAAAAARDWDVFLAGLHKLVPRAAARARPGLDFLLGYAAGQRAAAHAGLVAADHKHGKHLPRLAQETVESVRPAHDGAGGGTLLGLGRPLLAGLLENFERAAAGDLRDYDHLHQVRIAGKRLRYAMEVFADCFAAPLRERLYPLIEEMQEILGRANDSHVAGERLAAMRLRAQAQLPAEWGQIQPGVAGQLRLHQRRLRQESGRFVRWLETWRAAGAHDALRSPPVAG